MLENIIWALSVFFATKGQRTSPFYISFQQIKLGNMYVHSWSLYPSMFHCLHLYAANLEFILFLIILTLPSAPISCTDTGQYNPWYVVPLHETKFSTRILCLSVFFPSFQFFFSPNIILKAILASSFPTFSFQCSIMYLQHIVYSL